MGCTGYSAGSFLKGGVGGGRCCLGRISTCKSLLCIGTFDTIETQDIRGTGLDLIRCS